MDNSNGKNGANRDNTGEIISWVIVFICMFVFWPVGLLLLFRKLRGYAKSTPGRSSVLDKQKKEPGYLTPAKKSKKRNPLFKKTGKFVSAVLLLISITMVSLGVFGFADIAPQIFNAGIISWYDLILSSFMLTGGLGAFFSRNIVANRYARYKNYYAFIDGHDVVPLSDLAQIAGVSVKAVIRDLQTMLNNGFLDQGAYIDNELECLVLTPEAAEKLRKEIRALQNAPIPDDLLSVFEQTQEDQYTALINELREANSSISDTVISEKVDRLEELTVKIFNIVAEAPDKQSQIRRFLSYYLPTTINLLRSYATLEKQGVKGENIMSAKTNIGNILDTLATGYEQQLDQLFKADAINIAADINVLESLMQQDGLATDKSEFQTLTGTM